MSHYDYAVIAIAAIDWQRKHVEAKRLKDERNACPCENEGVAFEYDEHGRQTGGQTDPCFKDFCEPGRQPDDYPVTKPVAEWCPSCQRRDVLHRNYREMRKAAGIANRRLQALCRSVAS